MIPGMAPSPDSTLVLAIGVILVLGKIGILSYIADKCEFQPNGSSEEQS